MEKIEFREASLKDCAEIVKLVNSAYRGAVSRQGWTTEADFLDGQRTDFEAIAELISKPNTVMLLAEKADKLIGSVHLEHAGTEAYLGMFTVRPDLQNAGIGKIFIEAAENFVVNQWQCKKVAMTVITLRTELIAWYERRGYRRTGKLMTFPYGDERFGVPKRPDLEFEVLEKNLGL